MAVLDPATAVDIDGVLQQRASLTSTLGHAALYFPWIQAAPMGVSLLLPPSGFVAGAYARTAPPQSPAGNVVTATGVSVNLTTQQLDTLNLAGVDAIRTFVGLGVQIWGVRTISSDSDWRYVLVRRMGLFLEESIYEGTQWAVLEPNDAILWSSLQQCVESFMYGLFQGGWFQGTTPQQTFFVRVDQTTMTQQDIDEGRTIIVVGFAPVRPGEFVILQIVQQRNSSTGAPPSAPQSYSLYPAAPNPFNPSTSIRFDLSEAGRVDLRIYDVAGRLLATLQRSDRMEAGAHRVVWDGRDGEGAPVASGVYLYRLDAGPFAETRRMTLLK